MFVNWQIVAAGTRFQISSFRRLNIGYTEKLQLMVTISNSNHRMCVKYLQLVLIKMKKFNFVHVDTYSTLSGTLILKLSVASKRNFCTIILHNFLAFSSLYQKLRSSG